MQSLVVAAEVIFVPDQQQLQHLQELMDSNAQQETTAQAEALYKSHVKQGIIVQPQDFLQQQEHVLLDIIAQVQLQLQIQQAQQEDCVLMAIIAQLAQYSRFHAQQENIMEQLEEQRILFAFLVLEVVIAKGQDRV